MRLPAGRLHQLLQGNTTGSLEQIQDLGGLAALAGVCGGLRVLGCFGRLVALLGWGGLLGGLPLGGRDTGLLCATVGLLGRLS